MAAQVTLRDAWGNLAVTVSCKAIVYESGRIWLRMNERGDWELPGGRLDEGEQPEATVERELHEELGVTVCNLNLIDVYVWEKDFGTSRYVELVTFRCDVKTRSGEFERVGEAGVSDFDLFSVEDALKLPNLPAPYKRAIEKL